MVNLLLSLALVALLPAAPAQCGLPQIERMTRDSEVVFVGEVLDVEHPLMQGWSGLTLYRQHVRYEVKAVLKGKLSEKELWVGYPIYHGSLLADKDVPQLSPEVFKANSVHIVFMKRIKESNPPPFTGPLPGKPLDPSAKPPIKSPYGPVDVNYGALADTPAAEAEIRRIISKQ
jgi:hypothetical protein